VATFVGVPLGDVEKLIASLDYVLDNL
jgi:hypothetical protein